MALFAECGDSNPDSQSFAGYRINILGTRDICEVAELLLPGHLISEGSVFVDVYMLERCNIAPRTRDETLLRLFAVLMQSTFPPRIETGFGPMW
jgi:hypothetical protein